MPHLSELTLRVSHHKGRDDIARDFYLPCMQHGGRGQQRDQFTVFETALAHLGKQHRAIAAMAIREPIKNSTYFAVK